MIRHTPNASRASARGGGGGGGAVSGTFFFLLWIFCAPPPTSQRAYKPSGGPERDAEPPPTPIGGRLRETKATKRSYTTEIFFSFQRRLLRIVYKAIIKERSSVRRTLRPLRMTTEIALFCRSPESINSRRAPFCTGWPFAETAFFSRGCQTKRAKDLTLSRNAR